jgi:hypothetical protein
MHIDYSEPQDWRGWEALTFKVWIPEGETVLVEAKVFPLAFGRPEYMGSTSALKQG